MDAMVCAWIKSEASATVAKLIMFSLTRNATVDILTKARGKTMIHSELGYRLLRAEQVSLEKQIIWSLSRWRVYGDRDDFKRGMTGLDQLALLKSLDAMRDDRSFF